jgi:hypothetical protein
MCADVYGYGWLWVLMLKGMDSSGMNVYQFVYFVIWFDRQCRLATLAWNGLQELSHLILYITDNDATRVSLQINASTTYP